MEPGQNTPTSPQSSMPGEASPEKPKSHAKLIIAIVVGVIVIFAGAIIALVALFSQSNAPKTGRDPAFYYDRPGYDPKELGAAIGDPLALTSTKTGKVYTSESHQVMYACNIISLNDLNTAKAYVAARNDAKGVETTYIDGVGVKGVEPNEYTLPSPSEDNKCQYSLQSEGFLEVSVYQPPFTTQEATSHELERNYTKTESIEGADLYEDKDNKHGAYRYMLALGDKTVQVLFNGTLGYDSKEQQRGLLEIAAKNMKTLAASPKGAPVFTYESPTYKKQFARACDLMTNDDIKSLTGNDASIYATESWASSTGVLPVDGTLYNSIQTACTRQNTGVGSALLSGPFDQELEMIVTSFSGDEAAKYVMKNTGEDVKDKVEMQVGDEGFAYRDGADQNTVFFRQGRFIIDLMFDRTAQKNAGLEDTAAMVKKLTPYAEQVAIRLKKME